MRSPLVDGQGNFGSMDGDPPAAMRYTEARLKPLAEEMMADLEKETVEFVPNYDETTEEPTVLPAPFPNLLVNGSVGIAVGMATNVPPHNLGEVVDGAIWLIEHAADTPEAKFKGLLRIIPGPDFPTGARIVGRSGIVQAYRTGRGSITIRANTSVEESAKGDRSSIVVTEVPYQVNKAKLIEKIAELVRDKTIEGDLGPARRVGPRRASHRHRAQARRDGRRRPQQPLQAHAAAGELRRDHARHRRRPAAVPVAGRGARALHRVPPRGGEAPDRVRAPESGGAGPPPRGPEDRPRSPRRGHHPHPRVEVARRGPRRPDGPLRPQPDPGAGDPRHAAAAAHRPGAAEDRRRADRGAGARSRGCWRSSAARRC